VKDASSSFKTVFDARKVLQSVHSKSALDLNNVETVFSAFEMARVLGSLGNYRGDRVDALADAIRTVILRTVEETLVLERRDERVFPTREYEHLAKLIKQLREKAEPRQSVSVITFNYDMGLDYALHRTCQGPCYGLETSTPRGHVPLLKLHGSVNWSYCTHCKQIEPWTLDWYLSQDKYGFDYVDPRRAVLRIGSSLGVCRFCEKDTVHALIVPPTWSKIEYYTILRNVWARAAQELSSAEYIFVIGYSLPETDEFFRYLYGLGTVAGPPLKAFRVFDIEPKVEGRYRAIVGQGARGCFDFEACAFGRAVQKVGEMFSLRSSFLSRLFGGSG